MNPKKLIRISGWKYVLLLWLAILGVNTLSAQLYTFKKIGLEDGMPSDRVNDIIQDSRGFFWLATDGVGLVRYDGFEFQTIDMGEEAGRPLVTALSEDSSGNIWLANANALVRYDGLNFKYYYLPSSFDRIDNILINPDNEIFAAGKNSLYRMGSGDTLESVGNLPGHRINDIAWYERTLWFATDSGLYASGDQIQTGRWLDLESFGGLLYAGGQQGLVQLTGSSSEVISTSFSAYLSLSDGKIISMGPDGLQLISEEQKFTLNASNGLPDQDYSGCLLDKSGVSWLYSNKGLVKLENTAVRLYGESSGIAGKVFSSLIGRNGQYYIGAADGLHVLGGSQQNALLSESFPYGVILAIAEYDGVLWLGTERGLVSYNGESFREFALPGSFGAYVFSLKSTDDGLYIGTTTGIFRYRAGRVENITQQQNLPMSNIYAISEGNDGSLWFGTYTQGFIRKYQDEWEVVDHLGQVSFDSLRFNTFAAVSKDEIWAGTLSEGVFHIRENGYHNVPGPKLNFAEIRSMRTDAQGTLWMGTNKGITIVSRSEGEYRIDVLNELNPLIEEGCSEQALDIFADQVIAGTEEGLLAISLKEFQRELPIPSIAITQVELYFGDSTRLDQYAQSITPFDNVPSDLLLPNDMNFLSFTLAGLSGYHPEDLQYRYRIKGQNAWTFAGNRREAVYSNLKPGSYEFQAQASRDGKTWSETMVSYPFYIKSPLWQRWWFITLAVLFIAGVTYWYFSNRIKRINQRLKLENSLLDMERKALRLQMNPHFIFNALDSISSFIFKNDPKQAVRYLNNFAKLMRLTLESSMEHLHPVETEVSVLKNYLELEKLRFQGKFEYTIDIDEDIDYDVGIPPMLIQPHVENAILHGIKPKKEIGHLNIRFILRDDLLICEVEDDGIGREKSKEMPKRQDHRSMATQINRDRLRLLKLSKSEEIDIQIIDKYDPTGTKVIIKLPAEGI